MATEADRHLCHLVQVFLRSVLLNVPYPGQQTPYTPFPDIELVQPRREIVVSERNVGSLCPVDVPGVRITFLSDSQIQQRADAEGDLPYFTFSEAAIGEDKATLTLQLTWAASGESQRSGKLYLSGGGVRVRFQRVSGTWQAPSGPMATWMA